MLSIDDYGNEPLFNIPSQLTKILDRDLKAASIPKADERGRTIDVHAMRHTFGTVHSAAGVQPRIAQAAMRHGKIDLTMNVYTDTKLLDVAGAIERLPTLGRASLQLSARGTENESSIVAPTVAPNSVTTCQKVSTKGKILSINEPGVCDEKTKKPLKSLGRSRVSQSEADGSRTRNLRIDSPVL